MGDNKSIDAFLIVGVVLLVLVIGLTFFSPKVKYYDNGTCTIDGYYVMSDGTEITSDGTTNSIGYKMAYEDSLKYGN